MSELLDVIYNRRSIRKYKPDPIPDEIIEKILNAARLAPSAHNIQPWHFIVVTDKKLREVLSRWRWSRFLKDSPVVIVGCGDYKLSPKLWIVDVSIALQNLVIAATALGLGTCWVCDFEEDKVKELLDIPENYRVVALIAVGYPDEKPEIPKKKELAEITSLNKFGKPLK
ncbi:MAG: nitroreductase family protein [Candidatus Asgardarchaeia archaeon]